jgi:hypothetical protein
MNFCLSPHPLPLSCAAFFSKSASRKNKTFLAKAGSRKENRRHRTILGAPIARAVQFRLTILNNRLNLFRYFYEKSYRKKNHFSIIIIFSANFSTYGRGPFLRKY